MFIYSENINHKPKKIYVNEDKLHLLSEDVYTSDLRNKRGRGGGDKKLVLTYNKRASSAPTRVHGKVVKTDYLDTGKMDQDNADTYEVPLKGGITSYNITSIKGTEVMHYFKNNRKASMKVDIDGNKEEYELWMDDPEYQEFIRVFCRKVGNVLKYATNKIYNESKDKIEFKGISILPVYSSCGFNSAMVNTLVEKGITFDGLPVVAINENLFQKNLSNLQKDKDFIAKNKEYYKSKMFKYKDDPSSHEDYIDSALARFSKINSIPPLINAYNEAVKRLVMCYSNSKNRFGADDTYNLGRVMAPHYLKMHDAYKAIYKAKGKLEADSVFKELKGTKGPSLKKNTKLFWDLVKPFLSGKNCECLPIMKLEPAKFQIKTLPNDARMGMMNYYQANKDLVETEMKKIEGTIFVIFDDNVSGGATLSDICYQAKKLGVEYIIPITFGEMTTKYTLGKGNAINMPSKSGKFQNY